MSPIEEESGCDDGEEGGLPEEEEEDPDPSDSFAEALEDGPKQAKKAKREPAATGWWGAAQGCSPCLRMRALAGGRLGRGGSACSEHEPFCALLACPQPLLGGLVKARLPSC